VRYREVRRSTETRVAETSAATELFTVETPESVAFAYELAGLGSRGVAFALDMLLLGLVWLGEAALGGIVWVVINAVAPAAANDAVFWILGVTTVVAFASLWAYFVVSEVTRGGRTWGKSRMGLRVVRDDGSRVGVLDSVIRNLLRVADMLPGNYAVGMLCIVLNGKHKRLGDMAAGTVVVRDGHDLSLTFDGGDDSKQVTLARDFLRRRPGLTPAARMQVGSAILRAFGEEPDPAWDEPAVAARLAVLSGWSESVETTG
jgi:uncharacterized RDD family membrane protein YckC